jgi:endoglucanase
MNFQLLKKLSETSGVSGFETAVRELFQAEIEPLVDEVSVDVMGNLIAHKKGTGKKPLKVMIAAHMDEIGYLVTYIDDNGFLRLDKFGRRVSARTPVPPNRHQRRQTHSRRDRSATAEHHVG